MSANPLQLAPGTRLDHYEVLGPIGQGGMGEVYRALDLRLEREVALKVLRQRLAHDAAAHARFEREAKAIAALSHPNIVSIYDTGVDNGIPFSVTELLDGETLRARLQAGPMPWKGAAEIAASVADGLAAAHARGIVHRDIKPENVFLTRDGRVKILDFGLARSSEAWQGSNAGESPTVMETSSGTVMGTVGYMAPEQLRGLPVGPPADLFSLGCVLFEMASGQRAFARESAADVVAAVLHEGAPVLSDSGVQVPAALDRVIAHCLEKAPDRRFRSARDLSASLRSMNLDSGPLATADSGRVTRQRQSAQRSLAVLPFRVAGDSGDLGFLGEGISEHVINTVSGVKGIRVVPRTLSFRHAGREAEPRALGAELNADALLSGHITIRGEQIHVQADLVDTSDESQIWGSRFARPAHDLEAVAPLLADDICDAIWKRFHAKVERRAAPRRRKAKPAQSEAYQEYLRGRHHWNKWTREGMQLAVQAFRRAIELDPAYAPAYAGLADAYGAAAYYAYMPASEVLPLAQAAAEKAIAIDPYLAEAHATLGVSAMFFRWDWEDAERRLTHALTLNDRCVTAHCYFALFLATQGRCTESLAASRRAERLDPMSLLAMSSVAWGLLHTGDIEAAEAQLHRMLGVDPEYPDALMILAHLAEGRHDAELATRYNRRWFPRMGLPAGDADAMFEAFGADGWPGYWRRYLDVLSANRDRACEGTRVFSASIHALLGDVDAALDDLEQAYEAHAPGLSFAKIDLHLAALRGHPRFEALLSKIGLA